MHLIGRESDNIIFTENRENIYIYRIAF